jgi:hypothetical protein
VTEALIALSATTGCLTPYERRLDRWHTPCNNNTRVSSRYNTLPDHRETTIIPSPQRDCAGRLNLCTQQMEVRCR